MWLENFRQFLNRSLQRIGDWTRGIEFLPAWLARRCGASQGQGSIEWQGVERDETPPSMDLLPNDRYVDLSYRFQSLHCRMRVRILEPTPGMKFIYQALQRSSEA